MRACMHVLRFLTAVLRVTGVTYILYSSLDMQPLIPTHSCFFMPSHSPLSPPLHCSSVPTESFSSPGFKNGSPATSQTQHIQTQPPPSALSHCIPVISRHMYCSSCPTFVSLRHQNKLWASFPCVLGPGHALTTRCQIQSGDLSRGEARKSTSVHNSLEA